MGGAMKIAVSVADKEKARGAKSPYFQALVEAGAEPEEILLFAAADRPRAARAELHGVLFTGGEDVDPAFYDEKKKYDNVKVNRARDEFELALLDRALEERLPILGICRGSQMINVKFGGALYQDLKRDAAASLEHRRDEDRSEPVHQVAVTEPHSLLGSALQGSCRVNSLHHQAIKRVGRGLKVTAYSEDGLVEAFEAGGEYPFLMAVQWHPEEMVERPEQKKIFEQFLAKCREAEAHRRTPASPAS
jgi:putative glutamine amidotransferase